MAVNADAFTISAVLLLIVGAICFYLFSRIKQTEKKLALMEGILLDLKTATEAAFLDFPAPPQEEEEEEEEEQAPSELEFLPTLPEENTTLEAEDLTPAAEEVRRVDVAIEEAASVAESTVQVNKLDSTDLESLSVSELASIARSKGVSGTGKMRKNQLIAAIKEHVEPLAEQASGVDGTVATSSIVDSGLMSSPI